MRWLYQFLMYAWLVRRSAVMGFNEGSLMSGSRAVCLGSSIIKLGYNRCAKFLSEWL